MHSHTNQAEEKKSQEEPGQQIAEGPMYQPMEEAGQTAQSDQDGNLNLKVRVFKVLIVVLALVCLSMSIFIMAKSSQFFSVIFQMTSEKAAKTYLNSNYKAFMTCLYVAMIGFVVTFANTIIFFYRFSQKDKLLAIHLIYFLLFFITGIVALTDYGYLDRMESLQSAYGSSACTVNGYLNECYLSSSFLVYRNYFVSFFIVFLIFFLAYAIAYHYAVLKVLPLEPQPSKKEIHKSNTLQQANRQNQTLVSQVYFQEQYN